jgi:hypothetical protein
MKYLAPNIENILLEGLEVKKENYVFASQSSLPVDENIHNKIGVKKNSRVLFVAGGAGWWAKKIGEKTHLTFTDIIKDQVEKASKKNIGKKQFTINALRVPVKEKEYDWTLSFEPFPLKEKALPLVMLRGLLNNKGVKIISKFIPSGEVKVSKKLGKLYGVKTRSSEVNIKCRSFIGYSDFYKIKYDPHEVVTVTSNEKARVMAKQDLNVLSIINNLKRRGASQVSLEELKQKALEKGIEWKSLNESLRRIDSFSSLFNLKPYESFVKIS